MSRWFKLVAAMLLIVGGTTPVGAQIFSDCVANGAPISSTLPPVVETLIVGPDQVVLDVQVSVDVTHTFVGDLDIDLQSPAGTTVRLHDGNGGSADDMNLIYSDQGVTNGSQPYTCGCAMQPSGPGSMASFSGQSSQGTWTFTLDDTLGGDDGNLNQWCLSLFDSGPPPPPGDLSCMSSPGTGVVNATWVNGATYDAVDVLVNGVLVASLPGNATSYSTDPLPVPGTATVAVAGVIGMDSSAPASCTVDLFPAGTAGPDVIYSNCQSITNWGELGGIRAYSLGTHTCNIGDMNLSWTNTGPLFGMNALRLVDGRLEQIGMSWVKNATVAAAGSGCGLPCNGQGGSVLGVGCRDVYGSSYNGGQSRLGPRSAVNAFTGEYPGQSTSDSSVIGERLQVHETDFGIPGALYFIEGVYVAQDDATFGNGLNNASYQRVTVSGGSFDMNPTGSMSPTIPAIQAWQDHGLGVGVPDLSVEIFTADVPNEGRFYVANKVTDLGGGTWRYDYAVFNLNSHRSGGSFSVPVSPGVSVTNVGFHDVDYHSGEPYDNSDWTVTVGGGGVTWESPETFAQNQNTNALRWGTMYNFWFDADAAPTDTMATLGLFRPGTPDEISFQVTSPAGTAPELIRGDCNGDGAFDMTDALAALEHLFPSGVPVAPGCPDACDTNDDGAFDITDPIASLDSIFLSGPNPPPPFPDCGSDGTVDSLGCPDYPGCP